MLTPIAIVEVGHMLQHVLVTHVLVLVIAKLELLIPLATVMYKKNVTVNIELVTMTTLGVHVIRERARAFVIVSCVSTALVIIGLLVALVRIGHFLAAAHATLEHFVIALAELMKQHAVVMIE